MPATRDDMLSELKSRVVPDLRQRGFRGSLPHLRRITSAGTDLFTVQFDKWGGGFVVELGKGPPVEFTTPWGAKIPVSKLTAHDVRNRLRLGAPAEGSDFWFRYDDGDTRAVSRVADRLLTLLEVAEEWWRNAPIEHGTAVIRKPSA